VSRLAKGLLAKGLLAKGLLAKGLLAVAKRPLLWPTALYEWRALTPMKWWRHWPPVLGPSREYLAFRMQAMYGSPQATFGPEELVRYLEWCRWMRVRAR
jgi:hypothetical protein